MIPRVTKVERNPMRRNKDKFREPNIPAPIKRKKISNFSNVKMDTVEISAEGRAALEQSRQH